VSTAIFRTADGVEYVVPCDQGTTLLDAAQAAGHTLPSMCHQGSCGICRAKVVSGQTTLDKHSPDALSDEDISVGEVLLCCCHPSTDVQVALPYDSSRVLTGTVPTRQVQLVELDPWPGNVVRILVKALDDPELGSAITFDAGQFAELTPPDGDRSRAYSFASVANWDGTAEFYVRLHENGYFSEYLRDRAAVGDILTLKGPQGSLGLHENGSRPRWMVCGGTGLAPVMSMLRRMAEWGETQQSLLVFGVNTPDEVYATDEIERLCQALPSLRAAVTVMRPDSSWAGLVGTAVDQMDAELGALPADAERPDIYLCGPPGFLDAARASAHAHGVPDEQIYEERILGS